MEMLINANYSENVNSSCYHDSCDCDSDCRDGDGDTCYDGQEN